MKVFKVFINYKVTGHLRVVANSEEEAEAMANLIINSKGFEGPVEPENVGDTYNVLTEVSEEVGEI